MFPGAADPPEEEEETKAICLSSSDRPSREAEFCSSEQTTEFPRTSAYSHPSSCEEPPIEDFRLSLRNHLNTETCTVWQSALYRNMSEPGVRAWGREMLTRLREVQLQGYIVLNFQLQQMSPVDSADALWAVSIQIAKDPTQEINLVERPLIGWSHRAPEELKSKPLYSWKRIAWHFGVALFQLLTHKAPFPQKPPDELLEMQRVGLSFSDISISLPAKALLMDLLQFDSTKRLTLQEAQKHLFFAEYSDPRDISLEEGSCDIGEYPWERTITNDEAAIEALKQSRPQVQLSILAAELRKLKNIYERNPMSQRYAEKAASIGAEIEAIERRYGLQAASMDTKLALKQEAEAVLLSVLRNEDTADPRKLLQKAMLLLTLDGEDYTELKEVCDRLNQYLKV